MKVELRLAGQVLVIESEGAVTVQFRAEVPAPVAAVPVAEVPTVPAVVPVAPVLVPAPVTHDCDDVLFKQLSNLRRELANAAKVPPYVVFHDKTLKEMVEQMPADLQTLGAIPGVGASKLEKYGELFLSVIKGA